MGNKRIRSIMAAVLAVVILLTSLMPQIPVVVAAENVDGVELESKDDNAKLERKTLQKGKEVQVDSETRHVEERSSSSNDQKIENDSRVDTTVTDEQPNKSEKSSSHEEKVPATTESSEYELPSITEKKQSEEANTDKEQSHKEEEVNKSDAEPFEISHEPLKKINRKENVTLQATVPQADKVTVTYQTGKGMAKDVLPLERQGETDEFSLTIPANTLEQLLWSPVFYYSIQAVNENGEKITTDTFEVAVELNETVHAQQLPPLLITELVPDTVNVNKKDAYEFIEIYNNTNQPITMNDYQIIYRYPDGKADVIWEIKDDKVVQPQEAFIVWIHNEGNKELTIDDFNKQYGLDLTEDQVAIVESDGMANGSERTIVLADKNMNELVSATYVKNDVQADKGIVYKYPTSGKEMKKVGISETVTPTTILLGQVPSEPVRVDDLGELAINHTPVTKISHDQSFTLDAVAPNASTVTVTYQTGKDMEPQEVALKRQEETDKFSLHIPAEMARELFWSPVFYYSIKAVGASGQSITTETYEVKVELNESVDTQKMPPLLITEVTPDTVNENGVDAYEFIEIYNNTNQPIKMSDYQIIYRYPDGKPDQFWPIKDDKMIQPEEAFIVWIHNSGNKHLTLDDFNKQYGLDLTEDRVTIVESDGMANGSERTLIIADNYKNEIVSATYNDGGRDVKVDQGIVYRYPLSGIKMRKVGVGNGMTPLEIMPGQVPSEPVKVKVNGDTPVIEHNVPTLDYDSDIELRVHVTSDQPLLGVNAQMTQSKKIPKDTFVMEETDESGVYTVTIPRADIWSDTLYYHFTAANEAGETISESYELSVPQVEVDYQTLPELLITELVPDSTNVNGLDGYEFIEVYNNSNQDINFNDYVIRYRYPNVGKPGDLIWEPTNDGKVIIPSGEAVVFWIINSGNGHLSADDFNRNYGTDLVEGKNLFRMHNNGMANGSERTLVIATKTGHEISRASYNTDVNVDDTVADKGIFYRYPVDGTLDSLKISAGDWNATPGSVMDEQVPYEKVQLMIDEEAPVIEDLTAVKEVSASESVTIEAKITDNHQVKAVSLFYRTSDEEDFTEVNLEELSNHRFKLTISEAEFIGREKLEYYFVARDGTHTTETDLTVLPIKHEHALEGLRLNVKDGDLLSGKALIKATADDAADGMHVFVDDERLTEMSKALESDAYFAFEVRKTDLYFKNGVTMGDDILHIFDDTTNEYTTLIVPIEPERLIPGDNTITVRAGTKVSPFDLESKENRDDFYMKNIRLILADGTIIRDAKYVDPNVEHAIGDSAGMEWVYDFVFTIDEEHFSSHAFEWDTTQVADGKHVVKAVYNDETVEARVIVDNTAPSIVPSIEGGKTYKGAFTIDADVTDETSEVVEVTAQLNDSYISLPYETSSALLEEGKHTVVFTATDAAGNVAEKRVTFKVDAEHPNAPGKKDGDVNATEANLAVKVTDPTGDDLDVSFYEAFQYRADDEAMTISTHASDTEPPREFRPDGEHVLNDDERARLVNVDGETVANESYEQFPYHRFDVTVDEKVSADDRVEIVWQGSSLPGRKVTMYAWNYETERWEELVSHIAGEEAFQLVGEVIAGDYVKDRHVSVIVQDEIAAGARRADNLNVNGNLTTADAMDSDTDGNDFTVTGKQFSFVWFTDTQYYSESYPHIYESQVNWMVEQADNLNLKYVFHTGDLVDKHYDMKQWEVADRNMKILDDAGIPYGVLAGNHDVGHKEMDYTTYYEYFGDHRFKDKPYFGGSYLNNRGHYDLISAEGNDFIMIYMGWGVDEDGIKWMNDVLEKYPNRKAILNFHEYLLASGSRSPIADKIYEEVVKPNKNVFAILAGHYHNAQTLVDEIDDNGDGKADRVVYQMLANYQAGPEGGQGFLRILTFDPETNTMDVKTYSPYLDTFNFYDPKEFPGKDEFVVDFDLTPQLKKVATDFVEVNVYTNHLIDKVDNVPSGETATIVWSDLDPNETYYWYVIAEDAFGGKTRSDIWSFMTKDGEVIEVPEDNSSGGDKGGDGGNTGGGGGNADGGNSDPGSERPRIDAGDSSDVGAEDDANTDNSNNGADNYDSSNDAHVKSQINGDQNNVTITKDKTKTGTKLPSTATNLYNYILIGILLLIGGMVVAIRVWIKRKFN